MEVAVSRLDVTPQIPVLLAGYAHRTTKTSQVTSPLYVRMFRIVTADRTLLLVTGDFIWWDDEQVKAWKQYAYDRYHLTADQIVFAATHTHSGPQTSNKFHAQLGVMDEAYMQFLSDGITQLFDEIMQATTISCQIERYDGLQTQGIYRRKLINNECKMLPNEEVAIDDQLTVLRFKASDNQTIAGLVYMNCHPTVTDENAISSEYCGQVCERLEHYFAQMNQNKDENTADLHSVSVGFLQGFSADIRPNLARDGQFVRGTAENVRAIATEICDLAYELLKTEPVLIDEATLTSVQKQVALPFDDAVEVSNTQLKDSWQAGVEKRNNGTVEEGLITVWTVAPKLQILFFNAEISQSYGLAIKARYPHMLTVGYSDGMIGYVADAVQLEEGGYEAAGYVPYFHVSGKLKPETANQLNKAFHHILEEQIV